jgi:hypothetical protein
LTAGGCAVLGVPLNGGGQSTHYVVTLDPTIDLTGATIAAQVIAPGGTSGILQAYVQNSDPTDGGSGGFAESFLGWKSLSGERTWTTETWTVDATFDNTGIQSLGMSIESGSASDASAFEQPDTVVYVASIDVTTSSGTIYSISFDASGTVSTTTSPGPDIMWLNSTEPYLAGSTLSWLPAP